MPELSPILIAYDGSLDAQAAIDAAAIAWPGAEAVVLSVWQPMTVRARHLAWAPTSLVPSDPTEADGRAEDLARAAAEHGADQATSQGLRATARHDADRDSIWQTVLEVADDVDASVIVTGSRGHNGARSLLMGSTSTHLVHHAHRPVLVVPSAATGTARQAAQQALTG